MVLSCKCPKHMDFLVLLFTRTLYNILMNIKNTKLQESDTKKDALHISDLWVKDSNPYYYIHQSQNLLITSLLWLQQHEHLVRLSMQAVKNAISKEDEYIKEYLISYEKIIVLIHELICIEVWKEKIFRYLIETKFEPSTNISVYTVLYQEATLVTLLETVLYYEEAVECISLVVIDMLDYCAHKLTWLCSRYDKDETFNEKEMNSGMDELINQNNVLTFDISIKVLSIVGFLTDHHSVLPLSALHRLLNTHDFPVLLITILEKKPWFQSESNGKCKKYFEGKWIEVDIEEKLKLTKTEGQIWISLLHLLLDDECRQKYIINNYRKNRILKLQSYMNDVVIDQIPVLDQLQRYLHYLSISNPPQGKSEVVIEQIAELRESLLNKGKGKWKNIALTQAKKYFNPSHEEMVNIAKNLSEVYDIDVMEGLHSNSPRCALCGNNAAKRCSRCRNEWYCGRECQVKDWSRHKSVCKILEGET